MYIDSIASRDDLSLKVTVPLLLVTEDGEEHDVSAWSLDGIRRPESLPNTTINGALGLNFQGFKIAVPVRLAPGVDPDWLDFCGLDSRQKELLHSFYRGVVSGRMEAVDGVLLSLDTPVREVPMHEAAEDRDAAPKPANRWLRAGLTLAFYLVLAAAVFGSLGYTAWHHQNFVDMANARIVEHGEGHAAQGWLHDDDVTATWVGMAAQIRLNVDGRVIVTKGHVLAMIAGSEAGHKTGEGFLVQVEFADSFLRDLPPGTPVDIVLDRQLVSRLLR